MAIERSKRRVSAARLAELTRRLLDESTLFALATVAPDGSAHVNTAYFAWSATLELVWLSHPDARHSRNIRANATAAVAVYDSRQSWGKPDRGIQLSGTASEIEEAEAAHAGALYASRFPGYHREDLGGTYRFYVFLPQWVKLFDERELGGGRFVIAVVDDGGRLSWEATEIYRSGS
jgi:uncharacterized protein YhbP (UPF0306 family)